MVGWVAVTGEMGLPALYLFAIVFFWTPPHFWALALGRVDEYKKAGVPMLPVVAGLSATRRHIFWYSVVMVLATALPVAIGLSGLIYGIGAALLGFIFLAIAARVVWRKEAKDAGRLFSFSIFYLFSIFVLLAIDHIIWLSPGFGA